MSDQNKNNIEDSLNEIEKYIYDTNRNQDLVIGRIRKEKLSKRRKAYRKKKELEKKKKSLNNTEKKERKKKKSKNTKRKSRKKTKKGTKGSKKIKDNNQTENK